MSEVTVEYTRERYSILKGEREITKEESRLLKSYQGGKTISEIAEEENKSKTQVHNILQGIDLRYNMGRQKLIRLRDGYYTEEYKKALRVTRCRPEIVKLLGLKETESWVVSILEDIEETEGLKYRNVWRKEKEVKKMSRRGYTREEIRRQLGIGLGTISEMLRT